MNVIEITVREKGQPAHTIDVEAKTFEEMTIAEWRRKMLGGDEGEADYETLARVFDIDVSTAMMLDRDKAGELVDWYLGYVHNFERLNELSSEIQSEIETLAMEKDRQLTPAEVSKQSERLILDEIMGYPVPKDLARDIVYWQWTELEQILSRNREKPAVEVYAPILAILCLDEAERFSLCRDKDEDPDVYAERFMQWYQGRTAEMEEAKISEALKVCAFFFFRDRQLGSTIRRYFPSFPSWNVPSPQPEPSNSTSDGETSSTSYTSEG